MTAPQRHEVILGVSVSLRTATLLSQLRRRSPLPIQFCGIPLGQFAYAQHSDEKTVIFICPQLESQQFDRTLRHELYHVEVRLDGFPLGAAPSPGRPLSISDWMVMVGISVCDAVLHAEIEARMRRDGDDGSDVQLRILNTTQRISASGVLSAANRWMAPWVIMLLGHVEYAFWWRPNLYALLRHITASIDSLLVTTAMTLIEEVRRYDLHSPDGALQAMIFLRDYLCLQRTLSIVDVRTGRQY